MNKLRTIIRLHTDRVGLRTIAEMTHTSHNTVKKYVHISNSRNSSYEEFSTKSNSEFYSLFCVVESPTEADPCMNALEAMRPSASKELSKKGLTSQKQWKVYRAALHRGYSLTQFCVCLRRYERLNNTSMRIEHKAGDKLFRPHAQ